MPHKSPYDEITLPNQDLWSFLFERPTLTYPADKPLFIDPITSDSYNHTTIRSAAEDFGRFLRSPSPSSPSSPSSSTSSTTSPSPGGWNWQPADVFCFYTPNHIDTPAATWAVHWAGGICSPANPLYTASELAFQLSDSDAKALVTQEAFLPAALEAAARVGLPTERIVVMGELGGRARELGLRHWRDLKVPVGMDDGKGVKKVERAKVDPEKDLCFLCYSSGTTGLPKGVRLTHRNVVSNVSLGWICEEDEKKEVE